MPKHKPLTAKEIATAKALCEKATPGPWSRCPPVTRGHFTWGDNAIHSVADGRDLVVVEWTGFDAADGPKYQKKANARFLVAARTGWPRALDDLERARELLAGVHRRMVTDYHTGTMSNSPRYWSCRICAWIWKDGKPELHESTCPLAHLTSLEKGVIRWMK